ncbi:MAG: excinuclease ABC subunit UvrC, partial [Chloroflexota bacterium]
MIDSSRLRSVPTRPGCYLFKNSAGEILYAGKAASLRARMRSYFASPNQQPVKVRVMMSQAVDFETIVTDSELEALILENNIIKENRPKFNVRLRDDKQYPYICVTLQEAFPRVLKVRKTRKDGARYFGPYADGQGLNDTLQVLKKLFPYRSCDLVIPSEEDHPEPVIARPCLEYFIKRCVAPCVRFASREEYRAIIDEVVLFLEGKHADVLHHLRVQMDAAAEALDFEKAAQTRDQIGAVERIVAHQKITFTRAADQDVLAVAQDDSQACVQMFHIRAGKVVGQDNYLLEAEQSEPAEALASFLKQFYERSTHVPRHIVLEHEIEDKSLVEEWLGNLRGGPVTLLFPKIGAKRQLVRMVAANAREALEQHKVRWMS